MSDLKGFKELSKALTKMEKKAAEKVVRRGAAKMGQVIRKEMRSNAPTKTGTLRKNLKYTNKRMFKGGYLVKVGAFNDAYYAKFLEGGTKPHRIPNATVGARRNKRKNKARVKVGGKIYSSIQHPGTRPTRFLERSFNSSKSRAIREAGQIMFRLLIK